SDQCVGDLVGAAIEIAVGDAAALEVDGNPIGAGRAGAGNEIGDRRDAGGFEHHSSPPVLEQARSAGKKMEKTRFTSPPPRGEGGGGGGGGLRSGKPNMLAPHPSRTSGPRHPLPARGERGKRAHERLQLASAQSMLKGDKTSVRPGAIGRHKQGACAGRKFGG